MIDMHRRPMTAANLRSPTYYAPGVRYVTLPDGSARRADSRPLDVATNERRGTWLTLRQAWSYIRAEASAMIRGPVAEQVYQRRMAECVGCEHRIPSDVDVVGWCKACGCGTGPRALLTVKGRMPEAECPLQPPKWGKEEGGGPTFSGIASGLRGMADAIRYVVKRKR